MTRPILAIVLLASLAAASGRPFAQAPAPTPRPQAPLRPGYELVFAEEFDGPELDETIWEYREGRRTGASFIDGYNRRENVRVADGSLEIVARREPVNGQMENTGGGVLSRIDFGYGYYETRSQPFLGGRGVHSAFWQTGSTRANNHVFEIDSFEITSPSRVATNNLYMALQSPAERTPWPHRAHLPYSIPADGWIVDAYERTPDGIVFYDNGNVVARAEWPDLPEQQRIWLTALNGMGGVDPAALPGTTRFDYFRYFARDYPGVNLLGNGSFEYNQRPASDPIAWAITGAAGAVAVAADGAKHGRYRLRLAAGTAYSASVSQPLQHLLNGDYEVTAWVRSSGGQPVARLEAGGPGVTPVGIDLPAAAEWRQVSIPRVRVTARTVTLSVRADAGADQWLELDDVRFQKPPLPGTAARATAPLVLPGDPIWKLAIETPPIVFAGDERFYYFDRNVGRGDAFSVVFTMRAEAREATTPIARVPKAGDAGWAVRLTPGGDIVFSIGTSEQHRDLVARDAYAAGKTTRVSCVFEAGQARIYVDAVERASGAGFPGAVTDTTAPGRLGSVPDVYQLNDMLGQSGNTVTQGNFRGELSDVRIHNRALTAAEVKALGPARTH